MVCTLDVQAMYCRDAKHHSQRYAMQVGKEQVQRVLSAVIDANKQVVKAAEHGVTNLAPFCSRSSEATATSSRCPLSPSRRQ